MKQYLWAGLAVLFVNVYASDNPFDLKENFGKLDQDQEVLLSELKKIAAKKVSVEEDKKETIVEQKSVEDENSKVKEELPVLEPAPTEASAAEEAKNTFMQDTGVEEETTVSVPTIENNIESNKSVEAEVEQDDSKENEKLLQAVKEKEAELQRAKDEARKLEEAKKEAERREVEAYEKQRAEKVARKKEMDDRQLPKELTFFQMLIDAKSSGEHKAIEGKLKKTLENIVKNKNNSNYSIDDIKKEFDKLKGNKDAGVMFLAYIMAKSVVLEESMDSNELKTMKTEFQNVFKKKNQDDIFKKYPNEIKKLGFQMIEDVLKNGIPKIDMNLQMTSVFSTDSTKSEPLQLKIDAHTVKSSVVDFNISRENMEAKLAADKAYAEAVRTMDAEESQKVVLEQTEETTKTEEAKPDADIKVTREKEETKILDDKAYEEAVREMSQED